MLFLDTNAFYYAAGISTPNSIDIDSLRKEIERYEPVISSVTLFEFICHFGQNLEIIQKGGEYLARNRFKVAFNKYFPEPADCSTYVENVASITKDELDLFYQKIAAEKIDTESRLASIVFYLCFFSGAYFASYSNGKDVPELTIDIFISASEVVQKTMLPIFMQLFKDGYQTDSCENFIRDKFYAMLALFYQYYIPILKESLSAESGTTLTAFLDEDINWTELVQKEIRKISRFDHSTEYLNKLAKTYQRVTEDKDMEQYFTNMRNAVGKLIKESALRDYLCDIAYNCCKNGGAFYKNDILDAIIVCNLQEGHILITFDNGAIKYMEKHQTENSAYRNSIETIRKIKPL